MKLTRTFPLLIVCLLLAGALSAQSRPRTQSSKKTQSPLAEKIWWGFNMGNISLFNGIFSIGASPMVAYKITRDFSAGAILKFDYEYQRLRGTAGRTNIDFFDFSAGAFSRYKIFRNGFLHVEYEQTSFERFASDPNDPFATSRTWQPHFYVGGGYTSGGRGAYEISAYYNLLDNANALRGTPFDIRIGYTFNF